MKKLNIFCVVALFSTLLFSCNYRSDLIEGYETRVRYLIDPYYTLGNVGIVERTEHSWRVDMSPNQSISLKNNPEEFARLALEHSELGDKEYILIHPQYSMPIDINKIIVVDKKSGDNVSNEFEIDYFSIKKAIEKKEENEIELIRKPLSNFSANDITWLVGYFVLRYEGSKPLSEEHEFLLIFHLSGQRQLTFPLK